MSDDRSFMEKLVDYLPKTRIFSWIANYILVPFWAWRDPVPKAPGGPPPALQTGDNLQHMMNLVMPLKDKSPVGRAKAVMAVAQNVDAIYAGLDNVGTVHYARFLIVDNNLCMISTYDGDFTNYIRDFIATLGSVFNAIMEIVEDGEKVAPCEEHVEDFIQWVHERDMFQAPDLPTDLLQIVGEELPEHCMDQDDLRLLSRKLILQLRLNPNISLGSGYRGYPGFSAAEVRKQMGVGW